MEKGKKKLATLVGINYTRCRKDMLLRGCINDVNEMQKVLTTKFGFHPDDINILTDDKSNLGSNRWPKGANIKLAINQMIDKAEEGDVLCFYFSGHGTMFPSPDDANQFEDAIVPCDLNLITDQDFRHFVDRVPKGASFTIFADACHSGGLVYKEKEQIGPSVSPTTTTEKTTDTSLVRRIPIDIIAKQLTEQLKSNNGDDINNESLDIGSLLSKSFGFASSLKFLVRAYLASLSTNPGLSKMLETGSQLLQTARVAAATGAAGAAAVGAAAAGAVGVAAEGAAAVGATATGAAAAGVAGARAAAAGVADAGAAGARAAAAGVASASAVGATAAGAAAAGVNKALDTSGAAAAAVNKALDASGATTGVKKLWGAFGATTGVHKALDASTAMLSASTASVNKAMDASTAVLAASTAGVSKAVDASTAGVTKAVAVSTAGVNNAVDASTTVLAASTAGIHKAVDAGNQLFTAGNHLFAAGNDFINSLIEASMATGSDLFKVLKEASAKVGLKERKDSENPDAGILLSGCQLEETSKDSTTGGAFSMALRTVVEQHETSLKSYRKVVTKVREIIRERGYTQHPCLYCGDKNADTPFLGFKHADTSFFGFKF